MFLLSFIQLNFLNMRHLIFIVLFIGLFGLFGCNREKEIVKPQTQSSTGGGGGGNNPASSMTITRIEILDFPDTEWDSPLTGTPQADLFVKVHNHNGSNVFTSSTYDNIRPSQLPLGWNCNISISLPLVTSRWQVDLYDFDLLDSDDFICGFYFDPRNYQTSRNSIITLTGSTCTFRLYASYR